MNIINSNPLLSPKYFEMYSEQIKLLFALAKKQKNQKRSKEEIMKTFVDAGILTKSGNYTKNYPELRRLQKQQKKNHV